MDYKWSISELSAEGELITHAKYHVSLTDGTNTVETEGNWYFSDPKLNTPLAQVTEEMVVEWLKKDAMQEGKNIIESRLEEQVIALTKQKVIPPWLPQVFTPNLG